MILTVEHLKRIVAEGGSVVLDASTFTYRQIAEIVGSAAGGGNATVTLRGVSGFTHEQLRQLAVIAPGAIVFDLTG